MATNTYLHPSSRSSLFTYLCLRGLQLGATTICGTVFCYVIWQHNWHMCRWGGCTESEKEELSVPGIYILFVTLLAALFISIFVFTYRHVSLFLDELSGYAGFSELPSNPVKLIDEASEKNHLPEAQGTTPTAAVEESWAEELPSEQGPMEALTDLIAALREAYRGEHVVFNAQIAPFISARDQILSVIKSARLLVLLIDAAILSLFSFTLFLYTTMYAWGPVLPYCSAHPYVAGVSSNMYHDVFWRRMKVIDKECILSQVGWGAGVAVVVFSFLIVTLEAHFVRCEWMDNGSELSGNVARVLHEFDAWIRKWAMVEDGDKM